MAHVLQIILLFATVVVGINAESNFNMTNDPSCKPVNLVDESGISVKYYLCNTTDIDKKFADAAIVDARITNDVDAIWFIVCGVLVLFMQAGFAMLEAGSVSSKNTSNILFKNILDAALAGIFYIMIGSGFAYGTTAGGFIGTSGFFPDGQASAGSDYTRWSGDDFEFNIYYDSFFGFTFAAAAATIVSGAVAERCNIWAYFIYSIFITTFVYPVVAHWGWCSTGFLYGANYVDFAGSGIVHMVGGFAGLVGAICLGPRKNPGPPHSTPLAALGVIILWVGWYGFNCGSTLGAVGQRSGSEDPPIYVEHMDLAGKVAVTTTLAPSAAIITGVLLTKMITGKWSLMMALNCCLAGLVSITAPCATVGTGWAIVIGAVGAIIYMASSKLLKKIGVDDPLDACPVHGFCGIWGVLATGIFSTEETLATGGYSYSSDSFGFGGNLFATNLVGVLIILGWTIFMSLLVFVPLKLAGVLRISEEEEALGLDVTEHDGPAYVIETSEASSGSKISPQ